MRVWLMVWSVTICHVASKADGTELKTKVGGNAVTAASFALAEAGAKLGQQELFHYLASAFHAGEVPDKMYLPRGMFNIVNGGKHAGGNLKIQEFMIIPRGDIPFSEGLRQATTVYHHLGKLLAAKYGMAAKNLGDEGGFAPALESPHDALTIIEEAIKSAGFEVGRDMFLAMDCAATEFYDEAKKQYEITAGNWMSADQLINFYCDLVRDHPAIVSIEDGLAEQDYANWAALTAALGSKIMLVGDDLYTTNTRLITKGLEAKWANALLLKVNQIGSVSEAMAAARMVFCTCCLWYRGACLVLACALTPWCLFDLARVSSQAKGDCVAPVGRDHGFLDCRPCRRPGRAVHQDWGAGPGRTRGQVQPLVANRRGVDLAGQTHVSTLKFVATALELLGLPRAMALP